MTNGSITTKPYLEWTPSLTVEEVFAGQVDLGSVTVRKDFLYWLERRPEEGGRIVLVRREWSGRINDVTPEGYNLRSRVHEYGGSPHVVGTDFVVFINFQDQRLYRQSLEDLSELSPLTPEKNTDGSFGKFAAPVLSPDEKWCLFIYEKELAGNENENVLACLDITTGEITEPMVLAKGNDFYGEPRFSNDGAQVAWLTWDHPNMPWDETELWIADFADGAISNSHKVAGGDGASVVRPMFTPDNKLLYSLDEPSHHPDNPRNWWNIYCFDGSTTEPVTQELVEYGEPVWTLTSSSGDFFPDGSLLTITYSKGREQLVKVDLRTKGITPLNLPFDSFGSYSIVPNSNHRLYLIAASKTKPTALYHIDLKTSGTSIIKQSVEQTLSSPEISVPEWIEYPTEDGETTYGFFYHPKNPRFLAPENDLPPLLVKVHGGPTACSSGIFSRTNQFWTSSGFAILDVDHRGSTGYGREYRDKLKGMWGIADAYDVRNGVQYLIDKGWVAPKVAITGGSAGGYAVQRALTMFPDLFQVGASYFGIGNLITLVKMTHKFESKYLDTLLGGSLVENEVVYKDRSPINHLDQLRSPMIIFQGADDKVVTPENSREMYQILKERGIETEYVEYQGEAHGFRSKKNKLDSLEREAKFFKRILAKA